MTDIALRAEVAVLRSRLADATGQNRAGQMAAVLKLETRQARMLAMLFNCPGVVTNSLLTSEALEGVGGGNFSNLTNCATRLRARLKYLGAPSGISNVYGFGYRMTDDLRVWVREQVAT